MPQIGLFSVGMQDVSFLGQKIWGLIDNKDTPFNLSDQPSSDASLLRKLCMNASNPRLRRKV